MHSLTVDLGDRSYPILTDKGLLSDASNLLPYIKGRQVCIVTNETIAPLYLAAVKSLLGDLEVIEVILPDGESYKTLNTLNVVFDRLLESRFNRTATLIALGGGVTGDMTGFAAACYQRGIDFIQVPTTVLAMVDSSVGGKTGVNHPLGKNMIGAFYQPNCVLIDTDVIATLPDRELAAGIAEVIKYGLICDPEFYQWLEGNMDRLWSRDPEALAYAIHRSCQNKADVVAQDEREGGIRAILNLGHTFGHAIETAQGYGVWLHGEAVAAGMVMAADLSARMGFIEPGEVDRLSKLLQRVNLPIQAPADMTDQQFLDLMSVDKKVLDGRIRLVLLETVGKAFVTSDVSSDLLRETLAACRAS